jgi:molecular chaperone GrpE
VTTPTGDDEAPPRDDGPTRIEVEEEPLGGSLAASEELEAALREAAESVEARASGRGAGLHGDPSSADKMLLEALSEELQALKREFDQLGKDRDEVQDRHLRLQAEFDNFRRRGLKERQEAHNFGHQNVVKDLLPTVDNLDRAIAHSSEGSGGEDLQALLQGIELVRREFLGVLSKHGVTKIEAQQQPFDPAFHEAMSQIVDDTVPAGTVIQVLEEGYQLRSRMLRPSRVIVSKRSDGSGGSEQ